MKQELARKSNLSLTNTAIYLWKLRPVLFLFTKLWGESCGAISYSFTAISRGFNSQHLELEYSHYLFLQHLDKLIHIRSSRELCQLGLQVHIKAIRLHLYLGQLPLKELILATLALIMPLLQVEHILFQQLWSRLVMPRTLILVRRFNPL